MQNFDKIVFDLNFYHLLTDEAEAEIELLRKTFEENEEQHDQERVKYEELIKNSENEIQSLAQDFEIYRVQLSEKDEQMKQLIEIKDQLSHFINENDSLKEELQIQYQKVTEKTEENETQKSEISGFKRQIELLEGQVSAVGVQESDQIKVVKAQNSALSIELGETEESLRACQDKMAQLGEENSRLREEAQILSEVRSEIENRLREAESERDALTDERNRIQNDLESETDRFGREILQVKESVEILKTDLENNQNLLNREREQAEVYRAEIEELAQAKQNLIDANYLAKESLADQNLALGEKSEEIDDLADKLSDSRENLASSREDLRLSRDENSLQLKKLEVLEAQLNSAEQEKIELTKELKLAQTERDEIKENLERISEEKEVFESKIKIQQNAAETVVSEVQPLFKESLESGLILGR